MRDGKYAFGSAGGAGAGAASTGAAAAGAAFAGCQMFCDGVTDDGIVC